VIEEHAESRPTPVGAAESMCCNPSQRPNVSGRAGCIQRARANTSTRMQDKLLLLSHRATSGRVPGWPEKGLRPPGPPGESARAIGSPVTPELFLARARRDGGAGIPTRWPGIHEAAPCDGAEPDSGAFAVFAGTAALVSPPGARLRSTSDRSFGDNAPLRP